MMVDMVRKKVWAKESSCQPSNGKPLETHTGMKRDSVGWYTDWLKVPGNKMKRARMSAERRMKRNRSNMKMTVPMVFKP